MFQYYQPTRIHFGVHELEKVGKVCLPYGKKALLVTTPDQPLRPLYERVIHLLEKESIDVLHFDQVQPNPSVDIVEAGFHLLKQHPVDFILAIGGGSSIDTAKAIAFTNGQTQIDWDTLFKEYSSPFANYPSMKNVLPIISVPTTSGTGSQVTQASVITKGKEKITFFHPDNFSKECIIDPELMLTLPKRMSAATGFDAFTHAFESYINEQASYYSEMDSIQAMKLIIENLPKVMQEPDNITYRQAMCLADTLAGRALANSGASTPHPLSEIIGGVAHMTHGEALAVVFPPFIKQSYEKNKTKFDEVAALFGVDDLYVGITSFLEALNLNKKMVDFSVSEEEYQMIIGSPILEHLPFGTKDEFIQILQEAYA